MNPCPALLAQRIDVVGDCWEFRGADVRGYRRVTWDGKRQYAHRVVYTQMVGPIPDGLDLDHLCRNRACCNPAHLEPVTRSENVRRGDIPAIRRREAEQRTHCAQGHPYDDVNTYQARGQRACRECHRIWCRQWKARKRAERNAS